MELHFFGPAALTRAVLPHMRRRRSGAIVQISSMGGRLSFPGVGGYSATKFALEGLTEALAAEVRSLGITTTIVESGALPHGLQHAECTAHLAADRKPMTRSSARPRSLRNYHGRQPGDPPGGSRASTALNSDHPPVDGARSRRSETWSTNHSRPTNGNSTPGSRSPRHRLPIATAPRPAAVSAVRQTGLIGAVLGSLSTATLIASGRGTASGGR